MNLSRQPDPKYIELADTLRHDLASYRPGEDLPSETQLAAHFQVNRHTLRRALDVLADEGWVVRQQGRRTRVLGKPIVYPVHARSAYSTAMTSQGLQSQAILLQRRKRQANQDEAKHLALDTDLSVIELQTLRVLDGQPLSVITHCFAASRHTLLKTYKGGSVRQHLEQWQISLKRVFSLIGAGLPAPRTAVLLLMPQRTPVLNVKTLSHDTQGTPFELSFSVSRADRFQYQVIPEGEHTHDF